MTVMERNNITTMKGNPLTLLGPDVSVGQEAPDATVVANDLSEVKISSFIGKKLIISAVPSLDTPVCDLQTKRFNTEAGKLGDSVKILTISMDLPFAQKRWCGAAAGVAAGANASDKIQTVSDYRYASFGETYGLLIKGLRLLARAVLVIDTAGKIQYKEIVSEVAKEPNYDAALTALKALK
ncbi:MAG: thiol peroxidase [Candidatus Omnitrophica bacterium]|nr:thiol peroxidase [Candidatus Omnitrophota bacterium]